MGLFLRDFYYLYVGSSLHVFDVCHFLIKLFILLFLFGFIKSVFSVTVPLKYLFLQLLFALILNYFLGSVPSFLSYFLIPAYSFLQFLIIFLMLLHGFDIGYSFDLDSEHIFLVCFHYAEGCHSVPYYPFSYNNFVRDSMLILFG